MESQKIDSRGNGREVILQKITACNFSEMIKDKAFIDLESATLKKKKRSPYLDALRKQ